MKKNCDPPWVEPSKRSSKMTGFQGTNAVVTGASSGIGRAIAIHLSRLGVERILIHYSKNLQGAQETAAQVSSLGSQSILHQADFRSDAEIDHLAKFAFDQLNSIQTWVNNAGLDVLTGENSILSFQEKLEGLMRIDVVGTIRLSRLVTEQLQQQVRNSSERRPPSMVFTGWSQAIDGMEGEAGQMFAPVKASVIAFANSLGQSIAPEIRVNTVSPGWIQTAWGETTSDYWNQRASHQALMQRWGTPDDVAQAVAYLANPDHTFVTGHTIEVDGGWSRRYLNQP